MTTHEQLDRLIVEQAAKEKNSISKSQEDIIRRMKSMEAQARQAIQGYKPDPETALKVVRRELELAQRELFLRRKRESDLELLLQRLLCGLRPLDLHVPGYEEAEAYFVQEKIIDSGKSR